MAAAKYFEGIGRRKVTMARVRISEAKEASFVINEQPVDHFYADAMEVQSLLAPLKVFGLDTKMSVSVKISGGGTTGWKDAIVLGIARALVIMDAKNKPELRKAGFLTRDARAVERKKAGLKKARKAPRFSKR